MRVATLLRRARAGSGLSLRELAERAGTSHATLWAYEQARVDPSSQTVDRILRAAGFSLELELLARVGDGGSRGGELLEALDLASEFPARHRRELGYPPFGPQ